MTPATLLRDATADGIEFRMLDGTLKASGEPAALNRWLPIIREHKAAILESLASGASSDTGPRLDDLDPADRVLDCADRLARPDDRRHCHECRNLSRGVCTAAKRIGALEGYRPVDTLSRRCEAFEARAS